MTFLAFLDFFAYMVVTGDFPGFNATGVFEEDSAIVDVALTLHDMIYCDPTFYYTDGILTLAPCN